MTAALITGVAGQDGSYLAEHLLSKGYDVHGLVRRHTVQHYPNIQHLVTDGSIALYEGDLCDLHSLERVVAAAMPDEIYHLGAQSHVGTSFDQPEYTLDATGLGTWRMLEATHRHAPRARFYFAASSEQFGNAAAGLKTEATPMHPCSPYAIAKLAGYHLAHYYRNAYGMYAACGILFNHESERRGDNFVTRKITNGLARIKVGLQQRIELGNLHTIRDWGYASDYVEAMHLMLQADEPQDLVIATGEGHTVAQWLAEAWRDAGFTGDPGSDPEGRVVRRDAQIRPTDILDLVGDASKAASVLGWRPKTTFRELVRIMVDEDLRRAENEANGDEDDAAG